MAQQYKLLYKIVIDLFVLAAIGFSLLGVLLWAEPYKRGYFENDLSIRLPFKEQSISEPVLAGVGFAINVIAIILLEVLREKGGEGIGEQFLCGSLIPGWIWESYCSIGIFTFGAGCQQLTVNIAKCVVGRLRPYFYDVCLPVPVANSSFNVLGYIQDFNCTGTTDPAILKDMRLSFPSAHSSFAMYSAIFFIFYVQAKGKWRGSKLLRHGFQFVIFIAAWYVGLSRVVEHKHHWGDVAVGFFIGALYAVLVSVFVLRPSVFQNPISWRDPEQPGPRLPRPALAR